MSTAFREYWERSRRDIRAEFDHWVPEMFGHAPDAQVDAVFRTLAAGKRVRGCLVCLVCEALGGDVAAALPRAVAIECVHAASLIHDDYVDGDGTRRNRPAEWTLEGSRQAVLLGDVMFATVIHKMVEHGAAEGGLVAGVIAAMARGAYREYRMRAALGRSIGDGNTASNAYERIVHLKTGALFGAAAQLGAIVAGAAPVLRDRAFAFGARLGEAYQIADDLADVTDLKRSPHCGGSAFAAALPIFLEFSSTAPADLLALSNGDPADLSRWAAMQLPRIEQRMRAAIAARCRTAVASLAGFPANRYTDLLREMPADVTRLSELSVPGRTGLTSAQ